MVAEMRKIVVETADAIEGSWVYRHAPIWLRPYFKLARLDRPVGAWLLLWPCLWSIVLAYDGQHPLLLAKLFVLFAVGAFAMRGAGCTYNDIVDRDFDGQVERTRTRPIPAGEVSVKKAWAFLVFLSLVGLAVLLQMNWFTIWLGISSLGLVAAYPFMKRITGWPQAWLGLTFNWGALMGWAAMTGELSTAPIILYAACLFWTLGYDTVYAHQDKDDDALIGVKSTALTLGGKTQNWLWGFYGVFLTGLVAAGMLANLGIIYYVGTAFAGLHLLIQVRRLDIQDPDVCLRIFRSNIHFGWIVFISLVLGQLTA